MQKYFYQAYLLDKLTGAELFGFGVHAKPGLAQSYCSSHCLGSMAQCFRCMKKLLRGCIRVCLHAMCCGLLICDVGDGDYCHVWQ